MPKSIDRNQLHTLIANGDAPILVEALPEKYYAEGHLPGAKHLPLDQVKEKAAEIAPDKSAAITVYCASDTCQNSHQAAAAFETLGYTNVTVYAGGKKDWREAGFKLETD